MRFVDATDSPPGAHPFAAILAAARISGCNILYTEDLNPGQDYDGVGVVNPFADTA